MCVKCVRTEQKKSINKYLIAALQEAQAHIIRGLKFTLKIFVARQLRSKFDGFAFL